MQFENEKKPLDSNVVFRSDSHECINCALTVIKISPTTLFPIKCFLLAIISAAAESICPRNNLFRKVIVCTEYVKLDDVDFYVHFAF